MPTATYQAYNNFYGKGLYDGMSSLPNTVSGSTRAVEVSFDRPYSQPMAGPERYDWYTRTDVATVGWLERQGYDTTYLASEDIQADGARLRDHRVFVSGSHDEYWSQEMFDAAESARDAGTSLVFLGANAVYWKIRFTDGRNGLPNRSEISYKTVQSGPPDPSGVSTTTWRDPSGPNRPENELLGQMYVGENIGTHFPLRVSAQEGRHRFWRYTALNSLTPGTTASVGSALVGWEWDARVANGREPAGVETLASSPVSGALIQGNGQSQTSGTTIANATIYRAGGGALVFAAGTNNWWRGLGSNVYGSGEPDARIQQATMNVLSDMGVRPPQPEPGLRLDSTAPPSVTATAPADGSTGAVPTSSISATFDVPLDPGTVDDGDFTLTGPDDVEVPGSVRLDGDSLVLTPAETLEPFSSYTARVGTGIAGWAGTSPEQPVTWTFSTGIGTPPVVVSRSPAADATGVATDVAVTARFDRRLDPATVSGDTVRLRSPSGALVSAQVSYDDPARSVTLRPDARLVESTRYTAELTTGLAARDGRTLSAPVSFSFTTGTNVQISSRTPAPFASGVSPAAVVRAVFSRPADPATVDEESFLVSGPGGAQVPASVSYDASTRTATLTPDEPLGLMSAYTARVTDGVRGLDGAALDASAWNFTTAITPPAGPAVTARDPGRRRNRCLQRELRERGVRPPAGPGHRHRAELHAHARRRPAGGRDRRLRRGDPRGDADAARGACDRRALHGAAHHGRALRRGRAARRAVELVVHHGALPVQPDDLAAARPGRTRGARLPAGSRPVVLRARHPRHGRPADGARGAALLQGRPRGRTARRDGLERVGRGAHERDLRSTRVGSGWQRQALAEPLQPEPGHVYMVSVGLNDYYVKTLDGLAHRSRAARCAVVATARTGATPRSRASIRRAPGARATTSSTRSCGSRTRRRARPRCLDRAVGLGHRRADQLDRGGDVLRRARRVDPVNAALHARGRSGRPCRRPRLVRRCDTRTATFVAGRGARDRRLVHSRGSRPASAPTTRRRWPSRSRGRSAPSRPTRRR